MPAPLIASFTMNHPAASASGGTVISTFSTGFAFNFATSEADAEMTGLCHFPVAAIVSGAPVFSGVPGALGAFARFSGELTGTSSAPDL